MKRLMLLAFLLACGSAQAGTATFVKTDPKTKGSWQTVYGSDRYHVAHDPNVRSLYGSVQFPGARPATWATSSTDTRALQRPLTPTDRIPSYWTATGDLTVDIDTGEGGKRLLAIYMVDWDRIGRVQTVKVIDRDTNAVLDTRSVSGFGEGQYLTWTVSGRVRVAVTATAPTNNLSPVISGVFLDGTKAAELLGNSATYVRSDAATYGNWPGAYGKDGYLLPYSTAVQPGYGTATVLGTPWLDRDNSSSISAPQKPEDPTLRRDAHWYANPFPLSAEVNFTDGAAHQVALYARNDIRPTTVYTVTVKDFTTNAVLDTRKFEGAAFLYGEYLVWNVSGHVKFVIEDDENLGAALWGLFIGGASTPPNVTFQAFPPNVVAGQNPKPILYWESTGAATCTSPDFTVNDTQRLEINPTANKTYSLTCTNEAGSQTKQASVSMLSIPNTTKGSAWVEAYFAGKPVITGEKTGPTDVGSPSIMKDAHCKLSYYCVNAWGTDGEVDMRVAFVRSTFDQAQVDGPYGASIMCWGGPNKTGHHLFDVFLSDVTLAPGWPTFQNYDTTNMDGGTFDCGWRDGHLYVNNVTVSGWADAALDVKPGALQAVNLTTNGDGLNTLKLWNNGPHYIVNSHINNTRYSTVDPPAAGDGGLAYIAMCASTTIKIWNSTFNGANTLARNKYSCGDGADKSATVINLTVDPRTTGEMHPLF
jgi:hypothetical protein